MHLTYTAQRLWAKKSRMGEPAWLPLVTHLEDCAALAKRIWSRWLPGGVRRVIAEGCGCGEDDAKKLFVFIMAAHDIGKALPLFQSKPSGFPENDLDERLTEALAAAGLTMQAYRDFAAPGRSPHALAGQVLLEASGCDRNTAAIIGAHHGRPAGSEELINGGEDRQECNFFVKAAGRSAWNAVRAELTAFALETAGFSSFDEMPKPDIAAQVLLSGLAIMTDWIASNESYFPYIGVDDRVRTGLGEARCKAAFSRLDFLKTVWQPSSWQASDLFFCNRFGFPPRPLQSAVIETAGSIASPGIFIIEAPMGVGKTEPALAAAEVFASVAERSGVFFALPTQATSDGMFPRLLAWIAGLGDGVHSVELVHAKAQFNSDRSALQHIGGSQEIAQDESDGAAVYAWFEGRKKSLLADFAVGTVDQLLQLALKQKHVMLRHLALANKVVIIDECHAYDAYMNVYLKRALRWLGRYGVPVIMLSATLPAEKRDELVQAYLGNDRPVNRSKAPVAAPVAAYPLLTYSDGGSVVQRAVDAGVAKVAVTLERLDESDLVQTLDARLMNGGCAGIIVNTVRRAQAIAKTLREHFGSDAVRLLHARFTSADRIKQERALRAELGKPGQGVVRPQLRIVVGTQTIEQSLDLDFDLMISDLCPVDLLLQRIGRLHRHSHPRPAGLETARCFVLEMQAEGFEPGAVAVYGRYLLMRTRALLPARLLLPDDISPLVQAVYGGRTDVLPHVPEEYEEAQAEWALRIRQQEQRAQAFRIAPPWSGRESVITGWLDTQAPEAAGEASVRDTDDSLEVTAIRSDERGVLRLLSDGRALPHSVPDDATARLIARESLLLPPVLCRRFCIDAVIAELETRAAAQVPQWQRSPWLKGCLLLILNADGTTRLLGYRLQYDPFYGLICEKEDDMDG